MREFWKAAARRAARTMAQAAIAFVGANAVTIGDVDLIGMVGAAALAGLLSILMSIATGLPEAPFDRGDDDHAD